MKVSRIKITQPRKKNKNRELQFDVFLACSLYEKYYTLYIVYDLIGDKKDIQKKLPLYFLLKLTYPVHTDGKSSYGDQKQFVSCQNQL